MVAGSILFSSSLQKSWDKVRVPDHCSWPLCTITKIIWEGKQYCTVLSEHIALFVPQRSPRVSELLFLSCCTASPEKTAASGQCWESGNSRAGSRCSVSLPWASLVMHFLVWIFCLSLYLFFFLIWIGCKCPETTICAGIGFFQGQCAVYTRCPMFVWTFIGITD